MHVNVNKIQQTPKRAAHHKQGTSDSLSHHGPAGISKESSIQQSLKGPQIPLFGHIYNRISLVMAVILV